MIEILKDRYKIGLILAALFLVGIVVSLYEIYRLPHNLSLTDQAHPALSTVYVVIGVTFLIGGFSLWWALNNRNEVIVFRDKQTEKTASTTTETNESRTTISLSNVHDSLKNAKDALQAGLQAVCRQLDVGQGAIYDISEKEGRKRVELKSGYALSIAENTVIAYDMGEGLIGQAASGGKTLYLDDVPEGYVKIVSGLGSASPRYLLIVPVKDKERIFGVMELASFNPISDDQKKFAEESAQLIAQKISGERS